MFDIGFAELIIIGVVGLLVIGPEKLPGTIRTASLWLNRIRRGFNEIKMEVQQEIHNDAVMQELREAGDQLKQDTQEISQTLQESTESLPEHTDGNSASPTDTAEKSTAGKSIE